MWRARQTFAAGKRHTPALDHFAYHLERHLRQLTGEIENRTYRHSAYAFFTVRDPKRRQIAVASVRDRVIHRLVYDELARRFDRTFLFDVWSCRKGKGLHACIDRAQGFLASFPRSTVWRADIARFFESVDHGILRSCLRRRIEDELTWFLLDQIIGSFPEAGSGAERRGLPLGNVTSQVFANIVLHELDRFVVHTVRPLRYLRYGDDFLLFLPEKAEALNARHAVTSFLIGELRLRIHPRNDVVVGARRGTYFCGYDLYPAGRRLRPRTAARWRARVRPRTIGSYHGLVRSERRERSMVHFHWVILRLMRQGGAKSHDTGRGRGRARLRLNAHRVR